MKYLLAVDHAGAGPDLGPNEMTQSRTDVESFNTAVRTAGAFVFARGQTMAGSAAVAR